MFHLSSRARHQVLKPTRHAAVALLRLLLPDEFLDETSPPAVLAAALQRASGASLVALTAGGAGAALATRDHSISVAACKLPGGVVDATGAGDHLKLTIIH
jgi:sugar/nucleoside kinase (ribokinase family)